MWNSPLATWKDNLSRYPDALNAREARQTKPGLVLLDQFIWQELSDKFVLRDSPHVNGDEYSSVLRWKLKRGKWRPRLQKFADETPNEEIVKASEASFAALRKGQTRQALSHLVALKGCGPATASALLAAFDETVPFMSDELLLEAQGEKKKYTVPAYLELVESVREKATELSKEDTGHTWTARDIEKAVFASRNLSGDQVLQKDAKLEHQKEGNGSSPTRKRRRTGADGGHGKVSSSAQNKDLIENASKDPENTNARAAGKPGKLSKDKPEEGRMLRRSSRKKS